MKQIAWHGNYLEQKKSMANKIQLFFDEESFKKLLEEYSQIWDLLEADIDICLDFPKERLGVIYS